MTVAYDSMDFNKAYDLYIDFMKAYVLDIFIDSTRN